MVESKQKQVDDSTNLIAEYLEELSALNEALDLIGELGVCPAVTYDNLEEALGHKNTLGGLEKDLDVKEAETNPYEEQIIELKKTAVQEINWEAVNELTNLKDHQEFLYKLLTNKDSFVRKRIIDQNLAFLNQRLTYYLDKIGLPHIVEFQNDLTVTITQLGQDLDFDNLSRGERNRLILSLSWAFRDVWENLYQPINLLFIDELVDSGMDSSGVEASIAVLKKMTRERNKNVFLISHRDDLTSRVNHVLKVIKENGFTSYSNDVEIVG
jgi:DNA repair exonuclease SbcCD ATPase subunit